MSSEPTNFSGALATWKEINLSELQKTLDAQGIQLVDNQKESVVGRKALADKTKEFKKIPDSEKLEAFKGLLKAYQTEIDSLTKRSKASENAFLDVYKVLAEAPDPYPLLEAAVDQTVKVAEARDFEAELKRLREENVDLRKRVSDFASTEAAKKKSEQKVEQLEQKMEEMIQEKVAQKENELNATYDEKLRNYEEREQDLQKQVALTKNQLLDLRMSNESNQAKLMDQGQKQDKEVVAKLAELDMVVADLERANSRVVTVERRNEILRAEIETIRTGSESSDRVKSLQSQIADLEAESERLSRVLESQKQVSSEATVAAQKRIDDLSRDIQIKASEIDQLKSKLKQYGDYDEIKRELEIMKYVEFAGLDDADDEEGDHDTKPDSGLQLPNPNAQKANAHRGKTLEALLATKNKKLLEELTKFRIIHTELEASLASAEEQLFTTKAELEKQKDLNEKLETDLLSMNSHKPNGDLDASETDTGDVLAGLDLGRKADPSVRSTPIPFSSSADTTILPIVTSQRDRFRQRNAELEEELRKQFQIISELRAEIKNLQADNLKLYEKVRYMQSYREEAGSRPVTSQLDPLPASQSSSSRVDDMSKYRARYEEAMNPFEAFRGREATRAYQNLNPIERGVLILTRGILGNRRTRAFFIVYAIALHLLVMFSTYECTATSGGDYQRQPGPR
ncbi:Golgi membrane protein [Mycena indigotica]|uniref:Protein CASP n=1 Tax=Mycena indigotica TaxID=2126181 RepID=A0A8H6WK92_9AGAR|nr:Golgi membrane protein [Mycena indigotica]KAF7315489.1 Golgi membrane protein [Mycena indigotica]